MSEYRGGLRMMRRYPALWFVWSPGGRLIERLLRRFPPYKHLIARLVWRDVQSDPDFERDMEQGKADLAAGRAFSLRDGELVPRHTWSPDDPQQPEGWHHDGTGWVRS